MRRWPDLVGGEPAARAGIKSLDKAGAGGGAAALARLATEPASREDFYRPRPPPNADPFDGAGQRAASSP